ncbi:MAG: hypothetical protein KTV16_09915 [Acidimicrobiia bacterium]|nr:hypothetical protein [Acidimicrobiia bacterium]
MEIAANGPADRQILGVWQVRAELGDPWRRLCRRGRLLRRRQRQRLLWRRLLWRRLLWRRAVVGVLSDIRLRLRFLGEGAVSPLDAHRLTQQIHRHLNTGHLSRVEASCHG